MDPGLSPTRLVAVAAARDRSPLEVRLEHLAPEQLAPVLPLPIPVVAAAGAVSRVLVLRLFLVLAVLAPLVASSSGTGVHDEGCRARRERDHCQLHRSRE